ADPQICTFHFNSSLILWWPPGGEPGGSVYGVCESSLSAAPPPAGTGSGHNREPFSCLHHTMLSQERQQECGGFQQSFLRESPKKTANITKSNHFGRRIRALLLYRLYHTP